MADQTPNPFDTLAIETCQHVATYLDDSDLCHYRLICQSTHDAVDADRCSFWRRRFLATFEKPTSNIGSNEKYRMHYQKRKKALLYGAKFEWALGRNKDNRNVGREIRKGTKALEVLRDMIVDSFSEKKEDTDEAIYVSPNMDQILNFVDNHDLLQIVLLPERGRNMDIHCLPKPLLHTIWVMLAPAMLNLKNQHLQTYSFPISQSVVYGKAEDHPIFGGCNSLDVNMGWALHHLNFWKYHMVRQEEHTLFDAFSNLAEDEIPRFWNQQLKTGGSKLGKYWKGSYAYVERNVIAEIRDGRGEDGLIQDEFNGEAESGSFQNMHLEWIGEGKAEWPQMFEDHLHSLTPPTNRAKTRAQHRSATPEGLTGFKSKNFQFSGEGYDATEDFCAQGWLNALPPQQGIPGWQRMTMMKYFEDPNTGAIDGDALWAYEGVVLPGGQIMLGRWWSPGDGVGNQMYSGPFILWCVDGPRYADEEEEEDCDDDNLP